MLILVRHGRTPANAAGRLQGRLDQPLDDLGQRQAQVVAEYVGAVDGVISSPLRRARQTAEAFGREVRIDERWAELAYGEFEGVRHGDVPSEVWQRWRTDPHFVPTGGESAIQVEVRVREACKELADQIGDLDIVVVSHVSPIKAAVAWALDVDFRIAWRTHLSQAAICRIEMRPQGPLLFSFNERAPHTPVC
jgi:broad specificity phosphatase PhoE